MSLRSRENDYLFRWNGCDSRDLYNSSSRQVPGIKRNIFRLGLRLRLRLRLIFLLAIRTMRYVRDGSSSEMPLLHGASHMHDLPVYYV